MHDQARLPGLDLLRSIAILWVMCFHSFLVGGLGPDWSWLSRFGWMGVDLFFVLSGFLIGTAAFSVLAQGKALSLRRFYWRRALRILPAYWAVLLLYELWPDFREAPGMEPPWKFLLFIVNLDIDYARNAAFSHAWSLCVEEHFYLFFPVLCLALQAHCIPRRFLCLCALIVLGGMALRALIWMQDTRLDPGMARNWFIEDLYYPSWNRLDGLLCGVSLAAWKCFRPASWIRARRHAHACLAGGILVLALAIGLFQDRVGLLGNTVGWPVLACGLGMLVFAAAGEDNCIGRAHLPLTGWIATISYSLYLVHKPIYHLVHEHCGAWLEDQGIIAFIVYGTLAVMGGAGLHYAIERPFLQLRKHWQSDVQTA